MADFRDKLSADLADRYPAVLEALDQALKTEKTAWVTCKHCSKRTEAKIPDVKAALEAATFLADQSLGRPGVASSDPAEDRITFVRVVGDGGRILEAADQFVPTEKRDAFLKALEPRE